MITIPALSLREIAAWQLPYVAEKTPDWVGAIPSLQRGAVWKPGKIELFWDSVFRGFPVGSLVMCRELDGQASRFGKFGGSDLWAGVEKRHLLDGQQRCNAIAQGFLDPFGTKDRDENESILWIDLLPEVGTLRSTTRQFLFRVTTAAHPWGYKKVDGTETLSVRERDEATEYCEWKPKSDSLGERPKPREMVPWDAVAPVPLAWLFEKGCPASSDEFWGWMRAKLQETGQPWVGKVIAALENADGSAFERLMCGRRFAEALRVPVLEVQAESITAATHEESDGKDTKENIANIEHLFFRLNNGGEPISADDIRYSMLKAYLPGIEQTVERINPLPVTPARLVVLAARAARAKKDEFPGELSIAALRNEAAKREHSLLQKYFGIGQSSSQLEAVNEQMREWLLFRPGNEPADFGIPPVLRTSIARDSQEVFLLLMLLAERVLTERAETESLRKPIIGLATALHWFGVDKTKAAKQIHERLCATSKLTPGCFRGILAGIGGESIRQISSSRDFADFLPEPKTADLGRKNLQEQVMHRDGWEDNNEALAAQRWKEWLFIGRVHQQRDMIIYAQRAWMHQCFQEYEPRAAFWDDHHCPWDWDHLLPASVFSNKKTRGHLLWACQHWGNTIGNYHILPFRENRSRADKAANQFQPFQDKAVQQRMLLDPEDGDLDAFSLKAGAGENTVLRFAQAAHRRIVRIYSAWFDALDIGSLLEPDPK